MTKIVAWIISPLVLTGNELTNQRKLHMSQFLCTPKNCVKQFQGSTCHDAEFL